MPGKKTASKKTASKKMKKKVSKTKKAVSVVMLHCPSCGEKDEKIFYCVECDSPMDILKVSKKSEDDDENDITIDKGKAEESTAGEPKKDDDVTGVDDHDVKDVIETCGLDNIFSEGGSSEGGSGPETSSSSEEDKPDVTLNDALNTLDNE